MKIHFTLALVALATLLWHLQITDMTLLYPLIAIGLWSFNFGFRLYNVIKHSRRAVASIEELDGGVKIVVYVNHNIANRPGQYFYLYFPELPLPYKFQAHPLVAMRCKSIKQGTKLEFLMECKGKSRGYFTFKRKASVIVDGPWGVELGLEQYERVVLVGQGLGIAGLLSCAIYLGERMRMQSYKTKRSRTKKLDLYWVSDKGSQALWVKKEFQALRSLDVGEQMKVGCQIPDKENVNLFKDKNNENGNKEDNEKDSKKDNGNWKLLTNMRGLESAEARLAKMIGGSEYKSIVVGNHLLITIFRERFLTLFSLWPCTIYTTSTQYYHFRDHVSS
jgi:hypothetical protein